MGSKRFYEHAQNLLGGVKREVGKLTLGWNMGLCCIILNWIHQKITTLCYKYYIILQLYYIIIIYYVNNIILFYELYYYVLIKLMLNYRGCWKCWN